jgi:hypothetical protein
MISYQKMVIMIKFSPYSHPYYKNHMHPQGKHTPLVFALAPPLLQGIIG